MYPNMWAEELALALTFSEKDTRVLQRASNMIFYKHHF